MVGLSAGIDAEVGEVSIQGGEELVGPLAELGQEFGGHLLGDEVTARLAGMGGRNGGSPLVSAGLRLEGIGGPAMEAYHHRPAGKLTPTDCSRATAQAQAVLSRPLTRVRVRPGGLAATTWRPGGRGCSVWITMS